MSAAHPRIIERNGKMEDAIVTGPSTLRRRTTLAAVGLLVALAAEVGRAAAELPVPSSGPTQEPATVYPTPEAVQPGAVVHLPDPNGLQSQGCGERVLGPGPAYLSSGCWGPGCTSSLWYVSVDYVRLWRDIDNERTLINAQFPNGAIFSQRLEHDDFDWESAGRTTFGVALIETSACDLFLESTILGLHHANTSGFLVGAPGVTLFGSPLSRLFNVTNAQIYSYVSDMGSAEVNLKWDYYVDNSLFLLAGLRYIRFDDRLRIREAGALAAGPAILPQAFQDVEIENNLVGLQLGFDWKTTDITSRWSATAYGRAGLYANSLEGEFQQGATASVRGPFLNEVNSSRLQASGAFEGGFVGSYKISPNLMVRGGYHALWLTAIALAPDQSPPDILTGDYRTKISNGQDVFFHGPFVGLEYHWGCCR